jgi:hypothetical protein
VIPPGWPQSVCDPDDDEFPRRAEAWLWDVGSVPRSPDTVWRGHPDGLAFRVRCDINARLDGAREAYSLARRELEGSALDVAEVLAALEVEAAALQRLQREVALVAEALSGRRWHGRL